MRRLVRWLAIFGAFGVGAATVRWLEKPVEPAPSPRSTASSRFAWPPERVRTPSPSPTPAPAATPVASAPGFLTDAQVRALRRMRDPETDDDAITGAIDALRARAQADPAGCARWVLTNLTGEARRRGLEEAVACWTQQQPPSTVLAWLDQQSQPQMPPSETAGAYHIALAALAGQDGAGAAAWLEAHPAQNSLENWQSVLGTWAENHPMEALPWVTANPFDPGLKDALLPQLLTSFRDPGATAMLLRGSSSSAVETALAQAARSTSTVDPEYALGLARQLTDPTARDEMIARVFTRWLDADAPAARKYAALVDLPLPTPPAGTGSVEQPVEPVPDDAPPVPSR